MVETAFNSVENLLRCLEAVNHLLIAGDARAGDRLAVDAFQMIRPIALIVLQHGPVTVGVTAGDGEFLKADAIQVAEGFEFKSAGAITHAADVLLGSFLHTGVIHLNSANHAAIAQASTIHETKADRTSLRFEQHPCDCAGIRSTGASDVE